MDKEIRYTISFSFIFYFATPGGNKVLRNDLKRFKSSNKSKYKINSGAAKFVEKQISVIVPIHAI